MDPLILQYILAIFALIGLEILLSGDNAVVLGVMAKHLPKHQQKKALYYGLWGAVIFRFICFFFIAQLMNYWQIMAVGSVYLLYLGGKHLINAMMKRNEEKEEEVKEGKKSGFWMTVLKIELMDIVFAVDSMLAAIAFAVGLEGLGWGKIGGLDGSQFAVIMVGGLMGVAAIRFAASLMLKILNERPGLETAAYGLIFLIGIKLAVITLAHEKLGVIPADFPHGMLFQTIFWSCMFIIVLLGWFLGKEKKEEQN